MTVSMGMPISSSISRRAEWTIFLSVESTRPPGKLKLFEKSKPKIYFSGTKHHDQYWKFIKIIIIVIIIIKINVKIISIVITIIRYISKCFLKVLLGLYKQQSVATKYSPMDPPKLSYGV